MTGVELIAEERARQVAIGWSSDHDDSHFDGELAVEAARWAAQGTYFATVEDGLCGTCGHRQGKPRLHQLAVAGALIAAEIDRLQRLELVDSMEGDHDVGP